MWAHSSGEFGFVKPDNFDYRVYARVMPSAADNSTAPRVGQRVAFDMENSRSGLIAVNLRAVNEQP